MSSSSSNSLDLVGAHPQDGVAVLADLRERDLLADEPLGLGLRLLVGQLLELVVVLVIVIVVMVVIVVTTRPSLPAACLDHGLRLKRPADELPASSVTSTWTTIVLRPT